MILVKDKSETNPPSSPSDGLSAMSAKVQGVAPGAPWVEGFYLSTVTPLASLLTLQTRHTFPQALVQSIPSSSWTSLPQAATWLPPAPCGVLADMQPLSHLSLTPRVGQLGCPGRSRLSCSRSPTQPDHAHRTVICLPCWFLTVTFCLLGGWDLSLCAER